MELTMQCFVLILSIWLSTSVAIPVPAAEQRQDGELEGARLDRFLESRGASEAGRDVKWKVAARVFSVPRVSRNGCDLYVNKGIGILVPSRSSALEEVRRRGGSACIRGKVEAIPPSRKKKGDPDYVVVVRDLARRR